MIGFGRLWKGAGSAKDQAPITTIPRDVFSRTTSVGGSIPIPSDIEPSETRSAPRFLPSKTSTVLTTKSGKRLAARIINVSRTGVAVEPETASLRADEVAKVGSRPVTPGRRVAHGMVLVFQTPLKAEECGPQVVL
ncbi:hypothetical protein D3273_25830 [Lichenibacterium minor]|uniref:PilZ domain-containing protein n=1 Tax=Lichenibacterium minor TaxID=2316528 RepID=A0A4Q2TYC2_9HYPH|nr:hypothetical protein [Lichenibacterium minor]RYC29099.1 hypothetical protein D3273_25830 [Lichenibacterium minor]